MKKSFLLLIMILFGIQLMAQEKGSYISLWGGAGPTGFKYELRGENIAPTKSNILAGGQVGVGYSYFFTKHIGISTGLGVSHYRTQAFLKGEFMPDNYFTLGNYTDNDPFPGHTADYQLRVRIQDWKEYQSGKFVEIPLLLNFQKKFGEKEHFGLFLSLGAKFQIPFACRYAVIDGENSNYSKLMVSGYYEKDNLELGGFGVDGTLNPKVDHHGFSKIHNPSEALTNATGKLNFKFNVSAVAEAGILISLSRRVDLALGAFIDYGLTNINRKNETAAMFTGPETDYVSGAEYNVGNGISYNSTVNSYAGNDNEIRVPNHVRTFSYGGKAGIRIKLGKLSERNEEQKPEPEPVLTETIRDTVYIIEKQPVIDMDTLLQKMMDAINENTKQEPVLIKDTVIITQKTEEIPVVPVDDLKDLFEPIYFDLDNADIKPASVIVLNRKVEILDRHPEIKLAIYGNTCDLGSDNYNLKLGQKRADAARNYLIKKGIDPERLNPTTQASFYPELPNTNEMNRKHNRRADFKVMY